MNQFLFQIFTMILSCSLFGIALTGCGDLTNKSNSRQHWMQPGSKVKVLSTTAMIDDLVKGVGGQYVDAHVLIKGELDPHSYQLVKGDDELLAIADVIIFNGLGLEHGPSLQNYLTSQKKAIPLGNLIMKNHPDQVISILGTTDPHIWMDISLWSLGIPYIVEALSQNDPAHADEYKINGEKLTEQMAQVHKSIRDELQLVPKEKRYLVTSHDAFNYFTRAYLADGDETNWMERFSAPEGLAPESQISSSDIREILNHLEKYHINVIFPESNVSRDSIKKIVDAAKEQKINVKISEIPLYADAMGKPGSDGDTYLKMIQHDAKTIAGELIHNEGIKDREAR
jgi:manganese/zinc/iron transport system substrate-binding protein